MGNITKYLNDYLNMDNPQYAVLIQGKWGCGKTFYINQQIEKWENKNNDSLNMNTVSTFLGETYYEYYQMQEEKNRIENIFYVQFRYITIKCRKRIPKIIASK